MRDTQLTLKRLLAVAVLGVIAFLIKTVAKDLSQDTRDSSRSDDHGENHLLVPPAHADTLGVGGPGSASGSSGGCSGCG